MNILIKNADFSLVSIGTVGNLQLGSVLLNTYLNSNASLNYISSGNNKCVCVDLSQSNATKVKVYAFAGSSNKILGTFYSGTMPSSDVTFTSSSDALTFNTNMNKLGSIPMDGTTTGYYTAEAIVPSGTNTLVLNVGSNEVSTVWAIELLD